MLNLFHTFPGLRLCAAWTQRHAAHPVLWFPARTRGWLAPENLSWGQRERTRTNRCHPTTTQWVAIGYSSRLKILRLGACPVWWYLKEYGSPNWQMRSWSLPGSEHYSSTLTYKVSRIQKISIIFINIALNSTDGAAQIELRKVPIQHKKRAIPKFNQRSSSWLGPGRRSAGQVHAAFAKTGPSIAGFQLGTVEGSRRNGLCWPDIWLRRQTSGLCPHGCGLYEGCWGWLNGARRCSQVNSRTCTLGCSSALVACCPPAPSGEPSSAPSAPPRSSKHVPEALPWSSNPSACPGGWRWWGRSARGRWDPWCAPVAAAEKPDPLTGSSHGVGTRTLLGPSNRLWGTHCWSEVCYWPATSNTPCGPRIAVGDGYCRDRVGLLVLEGDATSPWWASCVAGTLNKERDSKPP